MPDDLRIVTLIIRRKKKLPAALAKCKESLSREEFLAAYGADPTATQDVITWARQKNVDYLEDLDRRAVFIRAPESKLEQLFGDVEKPLKGLKARRGVKQMPPDLEGLVDAVLGLHTTFITDPQGERDDAANGHGSQDKAKSLGKVTALRKLYRFPDSQGEGQCIGVIELKGGYRQFDVCGALASHGIGEPPTIRDVIVEPCIAHWKLPQGHNRYGSGYNQDPATQRENIEKFLRWMQGQDGRVWEAKNYLEVVMDVTLIASLAPKASIQVFFGNGDSLEGFLYLLEHALLFAEPRPTVLSISWSYQERQLLNDASDTAAAHQINELLQAAAMMGVTVCCSSGDWGATNVDDSFSGPGLDVAFPASSPWALACGGTTLLDESDGKWREVVWNHDFPEATAKLAENAHVHGATGGGYSKLFAAPPWQTTESGASAGRGTPDVAAVADPRCGIECQILGNTFPSFGTSASAPIWAGLIAVLNAELGVNVGCLNPLLHAASEDERAAMFTAITEGDNKMSDTAQGFSTGPGWNPCTGFGTPRGQALLAYLRKLKDG